MNGTEYATPSPTNYRLKVLDGGGGRGDVGHHEVRYLAVTSTGRAPLDPEGRPLRRLSNIREHFLVQVGSQSLK